MSTRVDGFVRSLEMVKVESWMILRKSGRAQEKVPSRLKRKNVSFVLSVCWYFCYPPERQAAW